PAYRAFAREHRIVRPDGSVGWVHARATVEYDDGRPLGLRGIAQDISERKSGAESLRRQAAIHDVRRGFAVAANESASLDSALRICVRTLCEHAGWQVGHAYVVGGDEIVS